jgi:hypothetical protein
MREREQSSIGFSPEGRPWGGAKADTGQRSLTGDFIWSVQGPGFYTDGNGLYLCVDEARCKRWILRIMVQDKRRDVGLGSFTRISLFEARVRTQRLRRIARQGGDPFAQREQVFSALHPEVTQAQREAVDLIRNAGVAVDELALAKLRY